MRLLKGIGRLGLGSLGLVVLLAGGLAFARDRVPKSPAVLAAFSVAENLAAELSAHSKLREWGAPSDLPGRLDEALESPLARFALAPLGLLILLGVLLPRRGRIVPPDADPPTAPSGEMDGRSRKKVARAAAALAKKGEVLEAAELAFGSGLLDEAAEYFVEADDLERAAEIRHDQNRFIESAELYLKAGRADAAGSIFSQQGEHGRAADAHLEAGNQSLAAEMFVKAGLYSRAGRCFADSGFSRHAAQAFVKCERWEDAARCLEDAIVEEGATAGRDTRKQAEVDKLHRMAANLYQRADLPERAQQLLVKGGCLAEAAEVAAALGREREAADLFLETGDALRAAGIMQKLGDTTGAARVKGEHYRDRGENALAAQYLEEAGEDVAAGDLYRLLEQFEKAGVCFERQGECVQAAEMFRLGEDRARAAANFARAEHYSEAAECYALAGDNENEAAMLEGADNYLAAGEIHNREGRIDEAIRVLQKVEPESGDSAGASALLGEIFRERGMLSLAAKKLNHAIGGQEIARDNLRAFYELATVYENDDELREAHDLYEKILAFDYHYEDAEARLAQVKERLEAMDALATSGVESQSSLVTSGREGRYQIVGKLGRGGMGIVYKAKDTVLDRDVAFKVLPDALRENPLALKNFLREAKSAAKLNHPNIVTVYDAGEQDGLFYIAMEYVDGNTLKEIIKHRGKIAPNGIVHVLSQMCEALAFAHEKKIVHRDVKTANTMWTRDRMAKIMDFGLAKVIEEVRNHTTVVSGTPYYMSPEQTLGKNIDHRTDIYSLGVTIFEIATTTLPFREGNLPYHHVHTPAPDPREFDPDLPPIIAEIISRCLQKDPADRYQSAREILSQLRGALQG